MRVYELMAEYLVRNNRKRTAKEAMRVARKDILPEFGELDAALVPVASIEEWHAHLGNRGEFMANRALAYLSAAYNLAEKRKMLPPGTNPCTAVARFPEPSRSRVGQPEELARLKAVLAGEWENYPGQCCFILCLMLTGARPSELLRANVQQYRKIPEGGMLIVPGKMGKDRIIFFPPDAVQMLDCLNRDTDALCGIRRMPHRWWEHVRKAAALGDLRMRDLRRTFATAALQQGVALPVVAEMLGHSDLEVTRIYARVLDATVIRAAQQTVAAL